MTALLSVGPRSRVNRISWNAVGIAMFLVAMFPVYWMVLTSFRRHSEVQTPSPEFIPSPGTLQNYRKVFNRDFFWQAAKNSITVTLLVVVSALAPTGPA